MDTIAQMAGFRKLYDLPFFLKKWDSFLALLSLRKRKKSPIVKISFFSTLRIVSLKLRKRNRTFRFSLCSFFIKKRKPRLYFPIKASN